MAKIIEKIVVDTSQHDEKLRKAKSELRSYASSQQGMENVMKGVTAAVGKFAAGLGIAMTATDSFRKIINASETSADEYGRVMQSVTSVTDGFFYALNTGNLSNFFSNLDRSIQSARELYDALDDLGSIRMNNRAAIAIQERALQELRVRKQAGENVDAEMRSVEARIKYLKNQEVTAGRRAAVESVANTLSDVADKELSKKIAAQLFVKGQDYFRQMTAEYERLRKKGMGTVVISQGSSIGGGYSSSVAQDFSRDNLDAADRRLYDVVEAIVKKEAKLSEAIGMWADAESLSGAISQQEFRTNRWAGAGGAGGGSSAKRSSTEKAIAQGSLADYQDQLRKANEALQNAATDEARYAASKVVEEIQTQITRMKQAITAQGIGLSLPKLDTKQDASLLPKISPETSKELADYLANQKRLQEELEATREKFYGTADAIGQFGSAFSSIGRNLEMPALNIMGTIAQAVASIMLGYAQATAQAAKLGPIAWAAFAASGLAQVIGIVSQVKSMGSFAQGGIAYGPTLGLFGEYSGASHNPEVVAPLDRLRSIIGDTGGAGGQVEFHIQGKELYGILNKQNRTNSRNA